MLKSIYVETPEGNWAKFDVLKHSKLEFITLIKKENFKPIYVYMSQLPILAIFQNGEIYLIKWKPIAVETPPNDKLKDRWKYLDTTYLIVKRLYK